MAHRFPKGLKSTQRAKNSAASGHIPNSPTGSISGHPPGRLAPDPSADNSAPRFGPRGERHEVLRISNITVERQRTDPNPLAKRFTKFIHNYHGQVRIPRDLLSANRLSGDSRDPQGQRHIDVGQIPED